MFAEATRRGRPPGGSWRRQCLRPESRAGNGHEPPVIRAATPGTSQRSPTPPSGSPGRRRILLPALPISCSGITLSDERGQAESARTRLLCRPSCRRGRTASGRTGWSGCL